MEKPTGSTRLKTLLTSIEQRDFTAYAYVFFHVIAIVIGVTASAWSLYFGAVYHFLIGFYFSFGLVISLLVLNYVGDDASRLFALSVVPTGVMALQLAGVLFNLTEIEFRIFPAAFALVSITLAGFAGRRWKVFAWICCVAGISIGKHEWYFVRHGQSTTVEALLMLALFVFTAAAGYQFMLTRRQLVRSREKAEEASRLKSRFISNMSHEIRTPLAGIVGLSNLIPMADNDHERSRIIARLRETTDVLKQQVDEMLDFRYLETAEDEVVGRDRVVIPDFIEECIAPYRTQAEEQGVTFDFRPADTSKTVVFLDKRRLRTVLDDVLANAVKFTLTGSIVVTVATISVSGDSSPDSGNFGSDNSWPDNRAQNMATRKPDGPKRRLDISVSDTGVGMSEEVRRAALEPFVQGDDGYSKRFPGKGLGLARASLALRQAGGTLNIVSSPGSGTTVGLEIPVTTKAW